jgi:hypothetical protein
MIVTTEQVKAIVSEAGVIVTWLAGPSFQEVPPAVVKALALAAYKKEQQQQTGDPATE